MSFSRVLALGALAAAIISAGAASAASEYGCNPPPAPADVEEVAPGVFVRQGVTAIASPENGNALANIGFIVGEDSVAVIDSGGSVCDGLSLRAAIREVTNKPIEYVINTHVHPDHILGNAAFESDSPIFIGHKRLPAALAARGDYYLEVNRELVGDDQFGDTSIVMPNETVDRTRTIDLGNRELMLTAHSSAHSENDLTVLDTKTGTLFTGDLVFMEHIPVIDGSITGWLDVMDDLRSIENVQRIVPGHGPVSAPWPEAMEKQSAYLTELAADVRRLLDQGGEIQDAKKSARDKAEGWELEESFHARNANAAFSELEWEQ